MTTHLILLTYLSNPWFWGTAYFEDIGKMKCNMDLCFVSHLQSMMSLVSLIVLLMVLYTVICTVIFVFEYTHVSSEIRPMSYFYWQSGMSLQRTSNVTIKHWGFIVFFYVRVTVTCIVTYMTNSYLANIWGIWKIWPVCSLVHLQSLTAGEKPQKVFGLNLTRFNILQPKLWNQLPTTLTGRKDIIVSLQSHDPNAVSIHPSSLSCCSFT